MSAVDRDQLGLSLERALSQAVRTPLHSLLGFLELLSMSELDADQRRLHEQLVGSAEDLLAGSDRVLWLVRLVGDRYRPRPARVHLASFVAEVAAASDGTVSTVVDTNTPPHIDADLAALHQLVTELVRNATAHGAPPVVLAVGPEGTRRDAVRFTISDGGAGLPSSARQGLYASVNGVASTGGLGLMLVRRLADLLGGTLQMLPTHIGTQVACTLPVVTTEKAHPAEPAPAPADVRRPLRVLLVEDNATNRLLTERQLTKLGHTLSAVTTGGAGITAALEGDAEVVLMDRHLPDLDGCEAAERIRAQLPSDRRLPIIAVTADATAEAREACTAAGMVEVLTKPVDLKQLGQALSRATALIDGAGDGVRAPESTAWVPPALRPVLLGVDGDAEAAAGLIDTYLSELPGRRLRIQAALRRGETRAVVAAAESLRTSSDSIGATAVSGACAALAAAARTSDLPTAKSFLPSLMAQCEQFAVELAPFTEPAAVEAVLLAAPA